MSLPTYASRYRHGEQCYMQPCLTTDATLYIFGVQADTRAMTDSAMSFLGAPTGGDVSFEAVGETALVHFLRAPKLTSEGEKVGYVLDRETAVSVPLIMKRREFLLPTYSLTNWMSGVLINTQGGCTAGREIFGFLKGLGRMTIPALDEPLDRFVAETEVFDHMDPSCESRWAPLYSVTATGGPQSLAEEWKEAEQFIEWIKGRLGGWSLLEEIELAVSALDLALSMSFPVVNLKQFRDAEDGTRACYQALVTAPMKVTTFRGGGLLGGKYELEIPKYGSHDVAGDLGLVPAGGTKFPVKFGMVLNFDFSVPSGNVVWQWQA